MAITSSDASEPQRGFLIAMEGCDRCGKSTQCAIAREWLQEVTGRPVELWKFPDRETPIGKLIDAFLKRDIEMPAEAIHLIFSANRWELKYWSIGAFRALTVFYRQKLEETLKAGISVIMDRYIYSGVAYSAAKV